LLFDPQYIMGSISHRYEAVTRSCYLYPIVTASGLDENILSPENDFAKFERTLLEFHEINFHEIFRIARAPVRLSNAVNKSKI